MLLVHVQRVVDNDDFLLGKLHVNFIAVLSVNLATSPLACFLEAERCPKNGIMPIFLSSGNTIEGNSRKCIDCNKM